MSVDSFAKTRGGKRESASRKKGSSVYGETTQAIRVPESLLPRVKNLLAQRRLSVQKPDRAPVLLWPCENPDRLPLPLFSGKVAAGFPSPADDYIEKTLDLNELLVQKPAATFFVRAQGDSMLGAGIHSNDILVVDRSLEPISGKIVICALNGELTVKRLQNYNGMIVLAAENPDYAEILVTAEADLVIWGVVTNVIHAL